MKYHINTSAIIDVTAHPYYADNTGKKDCTKILCQILDDILVRQVNALQETYDKLIELSDNKKEDTYIGIESGRVQDGKLTITFPENEPSNKIIYFPSGTYLISDTVTYTLKNLKQFWYFVPGYENCRSIHFLGQSKETTTIRLADNSEGYGDGKRKAAISFYNNLSDFDPGKEFTNVAFMNTIEDITIDCGSGNPGAIGVNYVSSNCGRIENLSIKAESGVCGIYLDVGSEGVISNVDVSGFDYGIDANRTTMMALNDLHFQNCRRGGVYTSGATLNFNRIFTGEKPTVTFKEDAKTGRYYFADRNVTFEGLASNDNIYFEANLPREKKIPVNMRSQAKEDWAFVDDFGAIGDGKTDSTRAIQRAMNSGKKIVVFGEGEYFINAKIKIPASVQTVDFLWCSLSCGTRLVGGEYDAAFEISEDSNEMLFIENLSAWEKFKGHMRLCKHAAKRDVLFSDIHLMCASMYFNSTPGSNVYFDNCFLTTGTYVRDAWIPGNGFVPAYCSIIPYEFHGQTVYGRIVNPERAEINMLNDDSDIFIDCYRIEGCGTALKSINGGKTHIAISNAGIGRKDASNPLFDLHNSSFEVYGALSFGFNKASEHNVIISDERNGKTTKIVWDDIENDPFQHRRLLSHYKTEGNS